MTKEVVICDICGKPINYRECRKFRVRIKEFHWASSPYEKSRWRKIDVHDKCLKELGKALAKSREQAEAEYENLLKNHKISIQMLN